jgi:outer membrane protein
MKKLLLVVAMFGYVKMQSQSAWTLQECINYALSHNIGLRQTALNNEVNKNNTLQSKAGALPSINAGAAHIYNVGKTIDRFTNTFADQQVLSQNFFVASQVVLWNGLSQYNTIKANEYTYKSGLEMLKQQEYDLSLNVANAYIGVIFSEEILKISQNQFEITREQLERTQLLVNAGSLAKSVEYDLKAQLSSEEVNVTTAENNFGLSLLSLRQLMNLDSANNFKVVRPEISLQETEILNTDVNELYETSLKNQPNIKGAQYSILSAEKMLAAARGRLGPSLSFNASMGTGTSGLARDILGVRYTGLQPGGITSGGDSVYIPMTELITRQTPFRDQFSNNVNKSIGFQLTIPVFNGLQTHVAIKNAKLNAMNAKLSQDLTKQSLYQNISQAYANSKAALNNYNANHANVQAAEESFKYAKQKFDGGVISAFEFNTAKNRLYAAESNYLQAKYDYIFKMKVLDFYAGKPLGFY